MEQNSGEIKKPYVLVLILIPENVWTSKRTLPANFGYNFLGSLNMRDEELVVLNPCCFCFPVETYTSVAPQLAEAAKEYGVDIQILFLDEKPSWLTS